MRKILLSTANAEENRIAVVENNLLTDYLSVYAGQEDRKGSIFIGTVEEIENSLNACFVNIGDSKKGFLQFNDIDSECLLPGNGSVSERLSTGMPILVQITKDSRSQKGPLLTTRIKLASNNLLFMPREKEKSRMNISRRADENERQRLEEAREQLQAPDGQSIIIRSNALDRPIEDLVWERTNVLSLWELILQVAKKQEKPTLIYEYQNIVNICLSEYLSQDTAEIICDSEETLAEVKENIDSIGGISPENVRLTGNDELLFDDGMLKQLDALVTRNVQLRSGGELVIDTTEAMVAIDINSKRSRGQANIENTAFNTNMEAATEIAIQLKLRNLAGLVVIDFIDMLSEDNRNKLENHVRREFRKDRARTNIGSISQFGLLEMTRQNIGRPLYESHTLVCPHCSGTGRMNSIRSTALNLLDKIRAACIARKQVGMIILEMAIEPATYLLNEKRAELEEIRRDFGIEVLIVPSANMEGAMHKMRIEKNSRTNQARASYEQEVSSEIQSTYLEQNKTSKKPDVAAITSNDIRKTQKPRPSTDKKVETEVKPSETGIFRSLVNSVFGPAKKSALSETTNGSNGKASKDKGGSGRAQSESDGGASKRRRRRRRSSSNRAPKQNGSNSSNGAKQTETSDKTSNDTRRQTKGKPATQEQTKSEENSKGKPEAPVTIPASESAAKAAKPKSNDAAPTPKEASLKDKAKVASSDSSSATKPEVKFAAPKPSPSPEISAKPDAVAPDTQPRRGRGNTVRRKAKTTSL